MTDDTPMAQTAIMISKKGEFGVILLELPILHLKKYKTLTWGDGTTSTRKWVSVDKKVVVYKED